MQFQQTAQPMLALSDLLVSEPLPYPVEPVQLHVRDIVEVLPKSAIIHHAYHERQPRYTGELPESD